MDRDRRDILKIVNRMAGPALRLLRAISAHPELSLEETRTSAILADFLASRGFRVRRGVAGMETAFRAEFIFGRGKPAVAYLCEMDALPDIGHACGHNIVGVASACAAAALAGCGEGVFRSGRVIALGTPAEETGYGKARMVEMGIFRGIDAAMMVHPSSRRHVAKGYLALTRLHFTFHGRAAHASAYPEHGINALDGVILLFNAVSALRQQLPDSVRVHGIVTEGGRAPNIIPERAKAYFYVRGDTLDVMADAAARVKECAAGAAAASRCRLEVEEGAYTLSPMKANPVLAETYRRALALMNLPESDAPVNRNRGSSDIGNVSQVVPTLQPNVPIVSGRRVEIHTRAFAEATTKPPGIEGMMEGIRALALTGYDLFADPSLVKAAWQTFRTP